MPTVSTSLRLEVDVFAELQEAARERGIGHPVLAQLARRRQPAA